LEAPYFSFLHLYWRRLPYRVGFVTARLKSVADAGLPLLVVAGCVPKGPVLGEGQGGSSFFFWKEIGLRIFALIFSFFL